MSDEDDNLEPLPDPPAPPSQAAEQRAAQSQMLGMQEELAALRREVKMLWALLTSRTAGSTADCSTDDPEGVGIVTEGSDTALTDEWESGDGAVEVCIQGRTVYSHSGDEKLYGFARRLNFDACGKLVSIGPEERYEIDAPEDC